MFIPGPRSKFFPSRTPILIFSIPDPVRYLPQRILTQKMVSRHSESDPGFSPRILILIFYPSQIPDPGVKKAPDPGSATLLVRLNAGKNIHFPLTGSLILGKGCSPAPPPDPHQSCPHTARTHRTPSPG